MKIYLEKVLIYLVLKLLVFKILQNLMISKTKLKNLIKLKIEQKF